MNRADVRELECLVAVADHLSFSKAAKHLNLSQPPLTRHIQALEEKLGTKLLERNTHAVSVTDHGRLFLEDARGILGHLDRANDAIRRARDGESSRLRLSFVGALLDEKFIRLIRLFRERHPDCQVHVADLSPSSQLAAIQAGEFDGGLIGAKPERASKEMTFCVWRREPLVLALPEEHPLIRRRRLRWQQLKDLSGVMVTRSAAPAFRQQFSELAQEHALSARVVQESDRLPGVLAMVAAGGGVSIVPRAAANLIGKGVAFRKLPTPRPLLLYTFAYRARDTSRPLVDFLKLISKSQ